MNSRQAEGTVDPAELDANAPEAPEELALAAEFPDATREEWARLVDQVLRKSGRLAEDAEPGSGVDRIGWSTPEGIRIRPLYTADDLAEAGVPDPGVPGAAPFARGAGATGPAPDGWDVRQRHAEPDPAAAKEAVAADLENGVNSIWLAVGEGGTAVADLPAVLDGVYLDMAPVVLDAGAAADEAAEAFLALAADVAPGELLGTLGLDPIGLRARTGDGPDVASVVPLARRVAEDFAQLRAIVVDALPVHAAGGSDAQELGFALAAGVAYLRELTGAGLDLAVAARLLEFRHAATAEQFPTIAKLRAARRLWSRVTEACGAPQPQRQHAVTSPTMLTRRDPYTNLLRGTVAGFAAGVGGADAVTVAPFDAAIGAPEAFSRRIARNTQSLLVQEAHLARVIDPAGGSWFVETLTDELAAAAWAFFQEIEGAGGAVAALDAGLVADRVAEVREKRAAAVATRKAPITGVSEFADLAEPAVHRRKHGGFAGVECKQSHHACVPGGGGRGLPVHRPAQAYEEFRDRADAAADSGGRPRAFLATLGPLADHTARAGFARNLLAAGGIDAVEAGPTETAEDVAAAFREAGTPVAVLCSTDAHYTERGEAVVAALRAAGAAHVLLAGRTEVPGLDGHLYAGGDALATIEAVYAALEGQK